MSPNTIWVKFGMGAPVKIAISSCIDVADVIRATKEQLELQDRLDQLYFLVQEGHKWKLQRPGMALINLCQKYPQAGQSDSNCIMIRKITAASNHREEHYDFYGDTFDRELEQERDDKDLLIESWNYAVEVASKFLYGILGVFRRVTADLHWSTIAYVVVHLDDLRKFNIYSQTGLCIALLFSLHCWLDSKSAEFALRHFTSSQSNMERGRYMTLLTSTFAHVDFNHLICNVISLVLLGPDFDKLFKVEGYVLFVVLSGIFSSWVSVKTHGKPSMGFSGVLCAMEGFLLMAHREDVRHIFTNYIIYCIARWDDQIDHVAHCAGFAFGVGWFKLLQKSLSRRKYIRGY
ncbi:hypothetical protein MP228_007035 [Amoeboaphelidium protococcarum]|nr:hypothetical protein MP228_007035 [Amoeboaphelidium protococcarum]